MSVLHYHETETNIFALTNPTESVNLSSFNLNCESNLRITVCIKQIVSCFINTLHVNNACSG